MVPLQVFLLRSLLDTQRNRPHRRDLDMPKTFTFIVPAPTGDEVAPVSAEMHEASTISGAHSTIGTTLLADIGYTGSPPETLNWTVAAADGTKFYFLFLVSAGGAYSHVVALAPEPTTADSFVLYCYASDLGLDAVAGKKLTVSPSPNGTTSGTKTIIARAVATTDANGYAAIEVAADAGLIAVDLGGVIKAEIDTTGLTGQSINLADQI